VWIISPPFLTLFFILIFQDNIIKIDTQNNFMIWLIFIVFIDVAHVYSTLFKTYFIKKEFNKHKWRYILIPTFSFLTSAILYANSEILFWSSLAFIAIFHFIRQQYGFTKLYNRLETNPFYKKIDILAIYTATLYPIFYWFLTPRQFNWFVDNEFGWLNFIPDIKNFAAVIYIIILILWLIKTTIIYFKQKWINIPLTLIISGTFLSWYFGIIYFNNDIVFTLLNVISHGIPYIGLIYLNEIDKKEDYSPFIKKFKTHIGFILFLLILIIFAFIEEFLWEILIWKENFDLNLNISSRYNFIIVSFLTIPQLTHYILDGFIWKRKYNQ
jgi:hypothetical protein